MLKITRIIPRRIRFRLKLLLDKPDIELSLRVLKKNGFKPKYAIDVGACRGDVTRMIKRTFSETPVLMIEPRKENNLYLKKICSRYPDCKYLNYLVGATEKEKEKFFIDGPNSYVSIGGYNPNDKCIQLAMTTLDKLTSGTLFSKPDFLKLDVEGYELEVLKGAQSVMGGVEVILMEVSFIPVGNVPIFYETAKFMDERGFRLYDMCTFFYRPQDKALWRIDAIFIRKTSRLLT